MPLFLKRTHKPTSRRGLWLSCRASGRWQPASPLGEKLRDLGFPAELNQTGAGDHPPVRVDVHGAESPVGAPSLDRPRAPWVRASVPTLCGLLALIRRAHSPTAPAPTDRKSTRLNS